MVFFYFLILILFNSNLQASIKVTSIIKLSENVPEVCGLAFSNEKNNFVAELTIKKNETKNTITTFSVVSDSYVVNKANLKSYSKDISSILNVKPQKNLGFTIQNETKNDEMNIFFQELLIGDSIVSVNDQNYDIKGPVDSKVRLEYLFCTGEMFLPNYEKK